MIIAVCATWKRNMNMSQLMSVVILDFCTAMDMFKRCGKAKELETRKDMKMEMNMEESDFEDCGESLMGSDLVNSWWKTR